jgi:signal transduction histidine kinase
MDSLNERADLGRAEPWLRWVGLGTWAFLGLSRLVPLWLTVRGTPAPIWIWPWLLYGAAFIGASLHGRFPTWLGVACLALQSVAALVLPWAGFHGFEGLMASIVVVQVPTILPLRSAVAWMLAQVPFLIGAVYPFSTATELMEILGAYSAFSVFALLVYWLVSQERRARRELAHANAGLLSTRALFLDGVRQGERLRISRELHDSVGHHLTALSLQLELAKQLVQGQGAEPVARAQQISREALGEVRRVVSAMQSAEPLDFVATLRALAAGIPVPRIHVKAAEGLQLDDREASHALFRCIQEAITNSVKHAGASNVWVEITRTDRSTGASTGASFEIQIRDDGSGVKTLVEGAGLRGIRARVAQLGGSADFGPAPEGGFGMRLSVPAP